MPRGYRYIILAAFGWLALLGNSEQNGRSDHQHGQQRNSAKPAAAPQSEHAPSADQAEKHCYGTSQPWLSCDAISAQAAIDQARDADKQASVVWWQFGVGALTLAAAVAAAIFAWRAAYHTKRSADAAQDSANAFLTVETARLKVSIADGYEIRDYRLFYPFQISNMGRTAATVTSLRIWMNSYPHFKGDNGTISVGQGMIIKADSVVPVPNCWTHVNHAGPGNPPPFPYLSGYLEYETVFGETVTTYFSYRINNDLTLEINKADGWPTGDKIERKKQL
jgi:hypothetical protein